MAKTLDDSFIDWEASAFGFGYGSGEPHALAALKAFFAACPESGGYDYKVLEKELSPPVAWLLINLLCRLDILEYGTSPRFAWFTNNGLKLKNFIDQKSADDLVELATGYDENHVICYPDACNCGMNGYEEGRVCDNPFWRRR